VRKFNSWHLVLDSLSVPKTANDVAQTVFLDKKTISRILKDMHIEGLVHIVDWIHKKPQGLHVPLYAYGPGKSVPRPKAISSAEKTRAYRSRLTAGQKSSILQKRRIARPDVAAFWIVNK
jgi:hypothetical protein